MVDRFREFIEQEDLCREADRILLAVSGGVDSIVMMDLFLKNGFKHTTTQRNYQS